MKLQKTIKKEYIFLLSLVVPILSFIYSLVSYKKPFACGARDNIYDCSSYYQYIFGLPGAVQMAFTVYVFIFTLILLGSIYSFLQKKYLLGSIYLFFVIAIILYYLANRFLL